MPRQTNKVKAHVQVQPPRVGGEQHTPDGLGSFLVIQRGQKGAQSAGDEVDTISVRVPVDETYFEAKR